MGQMIGPARSPAAVITVMALIGVTAGTSSYFIMSYFYAAVCETVVTSPFLVSEQSALALTINSVSSHWHAASDVTHQLETC